MKKLNGEIHVGRIFGHDLAEPVVIEITDSLSGQRIIDVSMTLSQYGDLVSGSGTVDCKMEVYDAKHIGKQIESKEEFVPFNWAGWHGKQSELKKAAAKAAKPFLVDGWSSYRESDFVNHHRACDRKGVKGQTVVFWRYVDPTSRRPDACLASS